MEQRLRNIETALRQLTGAALRRRQLAVTNGDFGVSGGGSVVVEDGGNVYVHDGGNIELSGTGAIRVWGDSQYADLRPDSLTLGTIRGQNFWPPKLTLNPDGILAEGVNGYAVYRVDENSGDAVVTSSTGKAFMPDVFAGKLHSYGMLEADGNLLVMGGATLASIVAMPGLPTAGAAANLNWNPTNGRLRVQTSSRRFKENIAPAEVDTAAVLALQPITYTRRDEADRDTVPEYVGFIAEDAAELGLDHWVTRDEDGEPWAFDYSQWGVALQAVVREQQAQLDTQATQLADQREAIAALTARLEALEAAS